MPSRSSRAVEAATIRFGIAIAAAFAHAGSGTAATLGSCTIVVSASGTMKPSADLKSLGTKNAGGSPGRATIEADAGGLAPHLVCSLALPLNCMRVSITVPSGFSSAPAGGNNNVTMNGSFSRVGSSSSLNLLSLVVLNGTHTFDFDLSATKSAGMFETGTYQAQQIIRCE